MRLIYADAITPKSYHVNDLAQLLDSFLANKRANFDVLKNGTSTAVQGKMFLRCIRKESYSHVQRLIQSFYILRNDVKYLFEN